MFHLSRSLNHRAARLSYRIGHWLRVLYWRVMKPTVRGCAVIARNGRGEVLLVRPSYGGSLWQFPGGGMAEGEDPLAAARREFAEETSLDLRAAEAFGPFPRYLHGATNEVHVVLGHADGRFRVDRREIIQAGWFAPTALPEDRSATVEVYLALAAA